jgi:hypothetical protein
MSTYDWFLLLAVCFFYFVAFLLVVTKVSQEKSAGEGEGSRKDSKKSGLPAHLRSYTPKCGG